MPEQPPQIQFEKLCIAVLKAIGKTLGQMNLYRPNHPAVKAIMAETVAMLSQILDQSASGVAYSLDNDKVIANGRIVGRLEEVPNTIPNTFNRFKLHSITFKAGIDVAELSALCQLASIRADAATGIIPEQYLIEHGVTHILLNEAIYAKVGKKGDEKSDLPTEVGLTDASSPAGRAESEGSQSGGSISELTEKLSSQPLETSLETLARCAVSDPKDQALIKETVMRRIHEDLEKQVSKATTELRYQKTAAENVSARAQAVLGNVSAGVVVVDDQGKILMMNPEAEEIFGVKMADMAGKPLTESVKKEHMLTLAAEIPTPKDRSVADKVEVLGAQDVQRTLRASTAVIQNEAGKPVGMVSALSDSAKHREIDKIEREFVAHVTHELRSPLTSIRAALEILDGMFAGRLQNEEKRMMDNALHNTARLEELIKGILDFSKIESGQMTVHPKPCDPIKVAREAVESMQPWAMRKDVQLSLSAEGTLPEVDIDFSRTVQVLVNLISNAIKFTPKGGAINIQAAPGTGNQSRFVVFSVADTGPGIPKEEQNRIFEKFVQIASGETHVGGTGLGLAIAKALVHLQRGQMWVDSAPGAGSKFLFTLPYYAAPPDIGAKPKIKVPWWKRLFGLS